MAVHRTTKSRHSNVQCRSQKVGVFVIMAKICGMLLYCTTLDVSCAVHMHLSPQGQIHGHATKIGITNCSPSRHGVVDVCLCMCACCMCHTHSINMLAVYANGMCFGLMFDFLHQGESRILLFADHHILINILLSSFSQWHMSRDYSRSPQFSLSQFLHWSSTISRIHFFD